MSSPPVIGIQTGPTFICPVKGCDWVHTPPLEPVYDTSGLDAVMGMPAGVAAQMAQKRYAERVERELAAHLDKHTSVEWLTTVIELLALAGRPSPLVQP